MKRTDADSSGLVHTQDPRGLRTLPLGESVRTETTDQSGAQSAERSALSVFIAGGPPPPSQVFVALEIALRAAESATRDYSARRAGPSPAAIQRQRRALGDALQRIVDLIGEPQTP